jgi:hypothetical protein
MKIKLSEPLQIPFPFHSRPSLTKPDQALYQAKKNFLNLQKKNKR